jgi:hypothetical protein
VAVPSGVDPREVLGVGPGASPAEVAAAFRRLAKRWHPDLADTPGAADRMALINAAYDALRVPDGVGEGRVAPAAGPRATAAATGGGPGTTGEGATDAARAADGLAPAVRRALGAELRAALETGEEVGIVVPSATWASPQTTLVVTDRRLLWLLDDAPVHRVRSMDLADVVEVRVRPPRPWRPRAVVTCTDRRGRRVSFGELPAATAAAVARRTADGRARRGDGTRGRASG